MEEKDIEYFRNLIFVFDDKYSEREILEKIPDWEYRDDIEVARNMAFCLVNRNENILVTFKKIKNGVYQSINVIPYDTTGMPMDKIHEPNEKRIKKDILFKLCICVRKQFVNYELMCGIVPCLEDEI